MPTLPKFLRCRGISSSTNNLKSHSSRNKSNDDIHSSTQSLSSKPNSFDPNTRKLPKAPASNGSGTTTTNHSGGDNYRSMPVFRTSVSQRELGSPRNPSNASQRSSESARFNTVHGNDLTSEELAKINEIIKLQTLLDKQADEALHLHNKDLLENDRLRRLNRDLRRQLKELQEKVSNPEETMEEETLGSDLGYASTDQDAFSSSTSTNMVEPWPNNNPSNFRVREVCLEQLDVYESGTDNPGRYRARAQRITISGCDCPAP